MSAVWIVITEDRHIDTDADPFSTESGARDYAWTTASENARDGADGVIEAELLPVAVEDGWVLLLEYGTEGDNVRVVKRELDATP